MHVNYGSGFGWKGSNMELNHLIFIDKHRYDLNGLIFMLNNNGIHVELKQKNNIFYPMTFLHLTMTDKGKK